MATYNGFYSILEKKQLQIESSDILIVRVFRPCNVCAANAE